jgi:hypothetical protein
VTINGTDEEKLAEEGLQHQGEELHEWWVQVFHAILTE